MFVTLLIPCHDEEEALPSLFRCLEELPRLLAPAHFPELLLVDDGSTDRSPELLRDFAASSWIPCRVLGLEPQRGLGAALREGAALAAGEAVVTYDADRAYPLEDIRLLMAALEEGYDLVTASPWHPQGHSRSLGPGRVLPSRIVSSLYRLRLRRRAQGLHTFTCGFRAYRKETLLVSLPRRNGFTATAEVLLNALRAGARVKEVPSVLRARTEGRSKMRSWPVVAAHLGLLLRG